MAKRKSTKGQTTIYKTYIYKTKDRVTRTPLKNGSELGCSGRVGISCATSVCFVVVEGSIPMKEGNDDRLLNTCKVFGSDGSTLCTYNKVIGFKFHYFIKA